MPYVWQENALFLEHQGPQGLVQVFYVYKDDMEEPRYYRYGLSPYTSDSSDGPDLFDARDLRTAQQRDMETMEDVVGAIEAAIRSGELTQAGRAAQEES